MSKQSKSVFPGPIRDSQEAVKAEAAKVISKIDGAIQKLAAKMRDRSEKAK